MKYIKSIGIIAILALAALGFAQTDELTVTGTKPGATATVTLTNTSGVDLGAGATAYAIGQLSTTAFTYGSGFLVQVDYTNVGSSVGLNISGSQADYTLAFQHKASGATNPTPDVTFSATATTIGSASVTGSAADMFAKGTGNADVTLSKAFDGFTADNLNATVFNVGAKAATTAAVDLNATVTITATAN
jgi:hypothetical protein